MIRLATRRDKMISCPDAAIGSKWSRQRRADKEARNAGGEVVTVLEPLGVSDMEEKVYRALLREPAAALGDLALSTGVTPARLRHLLSSLETKGLISRSVGANPCYVPVAPDVAVEGLVQRRQEELELIRAYLPQLREEYSNPADKGHPVEFVEVVSGREAVGRRFMQLQQSATETILIFDKPPYTPPDTDGEDTLPINPLEIQRLEEGIRFRSIYSSEALAIPGLSKLIQTYMKAGEMARVAPELPMKLAIADRRLAIMPLVVNPPTLHVPSQVESAVVIHPSSLLDALVTLFEVFWDRALPLSFPAEAGKDLEVTDDEEERERLLALLTAGLTDEAIAHQLGISIRTVRRRVRRLMDHLGVVSRFQIGIQAAKRGWL